MVVKEKKKPDEPKPDLEVKAAKIVKKSAARGTRKKASSLSQVVAKKENLRPERPSLFKFTLHFIYKNLYILGITLLRRMLRLRRRGKRLLLVLKGSLFSLQHKLAQLAGRIVRSLTQRVQAPLHRIRDTYRSQLPAIRADRVEGNVPIRPFLPVLEMVWRLVFKILSTLFNYIAPVVAVIFVFLFVQDLLGTPMALRLEYEGDELGYIQNESVFEDAAQIVRDRTLNQEEQVIAISVPSFELVELDTQEFLDRETIADMIISYSDADIETAYGLFVGGALVGAVRDKYAIYDELEAILEEGATGRAGENVEFVKSIRLSEALYPTSSVKDTQEVIRTIRGVEDEADYYEVQDGDVPTSISDKLGMRYNDLLALNPGIEEGLWSGDVLQTKVAKAFLPVKNIYTAVEEMDVDFETETVENSTYALGYEEVAREGEYGKRRVTVEYTVVDGVATTRELDSEIIVEPVSKRIVKGTNDARRATSSSDSTGTDMSPSSSAGSGIQFIWPTSGGTAKTYSGHTGNGVDIAPGGAGHPIYAAASGTVTKVVNGYTGYGHYIMIRHDNGYETLYAHNSANYVRVGEYVEQGQVIGTMGRTGWATGNHVHFEIRHNGRYQNPVNFIGYSG